METSYNERSGACTAIRGSQPRPALAGKRSSLVGAGRAYVRAHC
ncbi:Uncharacterised protein [Mycobacteroides abscessus subsp. abscessus]|nr:Uncharacterised protein [Mycobacteroides abscessus subsp. abscessus]